MFTAQPFLYPWGHMSDFIAFWFQPVWNISLLMWFLTIIPRARVGYEMIDTRLELAIIISYPTSASGIIVLLKTIKKYW